MPRRVERLSARAVPSHLAACALLVLMSASPLSAQDPASDRDAAVQEEAAPPIMEDDAALPESDEPKPGAEAVPPPSPGGTITVVTHAPAGAYPSVVKIVPGGFRSRPRNEAWQGEPGCTGVLIGERVVLTSQHCLFELAPVGGQAMPHGELALRFREVGASGVHSQTLRLSRANVALMAGAIQQDAAGRIRLNRGGTIDWAGCCDLAMLLLDEPVPRADLRAARVASSVDLSTYGDLILTGYGMQLMDLDGRPIGRRLLGFLYGPRVDLRFVEGNATTSRFGMRSTIMVRGQPVSAGLCSGDSGGPVFMARPGAASDMVVVGINHAVTIGGSAEACAQPGVVSYATGLLANRAFIEQGLAKFGLR